MNLANKVVLITGGLRGIGRAIVRKLISNDAKVLITTHSTAPFNGDFPNVEIQINDLTKVVQVDLEKNNR